MMMHDRNPAQSEDRLQDIRAMLANATQDQLRRLLHDIRMAAPVASHPERKAAYDA